VKVGATKHKKYRNEEVSIMQKESAYTVFLELTDKQQCIEALTAQLHAFLTASKVTSIALSISTCALKVV
jgi:hypothetical protein